MGALRLSAIRVEVAAAAFGSFATLLSAASIAQLGTDLALLLLAGLAAFCAAVLGFVFAPHFAFALAIAWFIMLEAVRAQVNPLAGATKELIVAAAVSAAAIAVVHRRAAGRSWHLDAPALVLLALFAGLYVFNLGGGVTGEGGYGLAWFHGTRLVTEPLLLMVVGMVLPNPRRSLRWALGALVMGGFVAAFYGLVQQVVGFQALLDAGYDYGRQVRHLGGRLRSFGTLGDPFAYAAALTFAMAAVMLAFRSRPLTWVAGGVIASGLWVSYVRTAALLMLVVVGIWLAQRGHARFALLTIAAAMVATAAVFAAASGAKEQRLVQASPNSYLTLNGRTNIWTATLEKPSAWAFGRGVGVVGTGSERAATGLRPGDDDEDDSGGGGVVDSAYFAAVADVGLLGLLIFAALVLRLATLARSAVGRGDYAGWVALSFLAILGLDGVTRESFTAFPTAWVAFLGVGLALGAALNEPSSGRRSAP